MEKKVLIGNIKGPAGAGGKSAYQYAVEGGYNGTEAAFTEKLALETGKYYSQSGAVYLCTRDTVNPVYSDLADLVGLYVEKGA